MIPLFRSLAWSFRFSTILIIRPRLLGARTGFPSVRKCTCVPEVVSTAHQAPQVDNLCLDVEHRIASFIEPPDARQDVKQGYK